MTRIATVAAILCAAGSPLAAPQSWTDTSPHTSHFVQGLVFTAAAVLVLGVGIGASAAVFTVTDAVLLSDLPYAHANRLAWCASSSRTRRRTLGIVSRRCAGHPGTAAD